MMNAQKRVLETQAEKNQAEAEKTRGADTESVKAQTESILQGIDNQRWQVESTKLDVALKRIQEHREGESLEDAIDTIEYNAKIALRQLGIISNDKQISDATIQDKISQVKAEAIQAGLQNLATKAGITKTEAEIKKIAADIVQNQQKIDIEQFKANMQAAFPGVSQTLGRAFNDGIESLFKLL